MLGSLLIFRHFAHLLNIVHMCTEALQLPRDRSTCISFTRCLHKASHPNQLPQVCGFNCLYVRQFMDRQCRLVQVLCSELAAVFQEQFLVTGHFADLYCLKAVTRVVCSPGAAQWLFSSTAELSLAQRCTPCT